MLDRKKLGKKGEEIAISHLRKKGYEIEAVNWVLNKTELDIVAKKDNLMVFVEVKTRTTDYFGLPENAVDKGKQERIIKTANEYIAENDIDMESRFDIISVILNKEQENIDHIEDAFYPLA